MGLPPGPRQELQCTNYMYKSSGYGLNQNCQGTDDLYKDEGGQGGSGGLCFVHITPKNFLTEIIDLQRQRKATY